MSEPTQTSPQAAPRPHHARMPKFATAIQDNLLLPLLILASGYVNGVMLVDGWVPNIEDYHTWGIFHGAGVPLLFAAGLAMGGLTLRVSYKLSECVLRRQWGRALFLGLGMAVLAVIEFWASFSQRAPNLHRTAADALLPIPALPFSIAAVLIALVIPFASQLWGFAADDPAPAPVEDPETLKARLENDRIKAQHRAEMQKIGAAGVRGAAGALFGGNAATVAQPQDAPDSPAQAGTPSPVVPPRLANAIRRGRASHVETSADALAAQTP